MADPNVTPLQFWNTSGNMNIVPWEEVSGDTTGTGDAHLGPDGVGCGMTIRIPWSYLQLAVQLILGFSFRDTISVGRFALSPVLRRRLPWQFPYWNQLYAKAITKIEGEIPQGNSQKGNVVDLFQFAVEAGGLGQGFGPNNGPWSVFKFARITIQFWRPPYFIRTDNDIIATLGPMAGQQQEWLRYVDKEWEMSAQMLASESGQFICAPKQQDGSSFGPAAGETFVGSVGRQVAHMKVARTWYEIPEACIFTFLPDGTPNGLPAGLFYMKTPTTNPVTGYVQSASTVVGNVGYRTYPLLGTVNSPIGGGVFNFTQDANNYDLRFLGCPMGTLRLDAIKLTPRPLQLPPYLMQIPLFEQNEPISQQQYNVTFIWDFFDPPRSPFVLSQTAIQLSNYTFLYGTANNQITSPALNSGFIAEAYRGHNLVPRQDGLWHMYIGQLVIPGSTTSTTAFQYGDMSDLFQVI